MILLGFFPLGFLPLGFLPLGFFPLGSLLLGVTLQQIPPDVQRAEAERRARAGHRAEALHLFRSIAEENPRDVEARAWIGRLELWMRHPREARDTFRAILAERPDDTEAIVGLGASQLALGDVDEAVATLTRASELAPQDADVRVALARAHRLAGHTTRAMRDFEQAAALRPGDPEIRQALEQTRRLWQHRVDAGFFGERDNGPLSGTANGDINLSMRVDDRLRVLGRVQTQRKFGFTDTRAGGGVEWRARRDVTVNASALFAGPDAEILPKHDVASEVRYTRGAFELTGGVRRVQFPDASVWIFAPGLTYWVSDRWYVGGRLYRAQTAYADRTGPSVGASSGIVQTGVNVHPRVWITGAYARGNETFETLSPDRLGRFSADTAAGGLRLDLPNLTSIGVGVEHQWRRASDVRMVRVSLGVTQRF